MNRKIEEWEDDGGSTAAGRGRARQQRNRTAATSVAAMGETDMRETDTGTFRIFIENGGGPTLRDFLVDTVSGTEEWTRRRVTSLNAEMARNNPREHAHGRRYYYRAAGLEVSKTEDGAVPPQPPPL